MVCPCSRDKTQRVKGDNTEGLMGEAWEYLCIKVANQSPLFEDRGDKIDTERMGPEGLTEEIGNRAEEDELLFQNNYQAWN